MGVRNRFVAVVAIVTLIAGSAVLVAAPPAGATTATITVTSSADAPGTCPSVSNCTLVQAITNANNGGANQNDDVTISIDPSVSTITLTTNLVHNGGAGGTHALTIDGNGATITTNNPIQLFSSSTTGLITITDSTWSDGSHGFSGGAVFIAGPLTITDSTFTNNLSANFGGAVYAGGFLEMHRVEFTGNDSGYDGGGFRAAAGAEITDAVFTNNHTYSSGAAGTVVGDATFERIDASGNQAIQGGGAFKVTQDAEVSEVFLENNVAGACGGGIYVLQQLTLTNSVFTSNSDTSGGCGGGGVAAFGATISNTEFTGNSATNLGGGVYVDNATVSESDFAGNSADLGGGLLALTSFNVSTSSFVDNSAQTYGGALLSDVGNSTLLSSTVVDNTAGTNGVVFAVNALTIAASTIVGNSVTASGAASIVRSPTISLFATVLDNDNPSDSLCSSSATSAGYNYANDTTCGLTATGDSQSASNDPVLSAIGDHGGDTSTMVPLAGSPLVGAIPNSACFTGLASSATSDQRGFARPNTAGGSCDIGAVQLAPTITVSLLNSGQLEVAVTEFASTVTITMYSTPVVLGTISVNANGVGSATFDVPCGIEGGVHTITATASSGQTASVLVPLDACLLPSPDVVVPAFAG